MPTDNNTLQEYYNEAERRGLFKSDPKLRALADEAKRRGMIHDTARPAVQPATPAPARYEMTIDGKTFNVDWSKPKPPTAADWNRLAAGIRAKTGAKAPAQPKPTPAPLGMGDLRMAEERQEKGRQATARKQIETMSPTDRLELATQTARFGSHMDAKARHRELSLALSAQPGFSKLSDRQKIDIDRAARHIAEVGHQDPAHGIYSLPDYARRINDLNIRGYKPDSNAWKAGVNGIDRFIAMLRGAGSDGSLSSEIDRDRLSRPFAQQFAAVDPRPLAYSLAPEAMQKLELAPHSGIPGFGASMLKLGASQVNAENGAISAALLATGGLGLPGKIIAGVASGAFGVLGARLMHEGFARFHETGNTDDLATGVLGGIMAAAPALHLRTEIKARVAERLAKAREGARYVGETGREARRTATARAESQQRAVKIGTVTERSTTAPKTPAAKPTPEAIRQQARKRYAAQGGAFDREGHPTDTTRYLRSLDEARADAEKPAPEPKPRPGQRAAAPKEQSRTTFGTKPEAKTKTPVEQHLDQTEKETAAAIKARTAARRNQSKPEAELHTVTPTEDGKGYQLKDRSGKVIATATGKDAQSALLQIAERKAAEKRVAVESQKPAETPAPSKATDTPVRPESAAERPVARFTTERGSQYTHHADGTTTRNKAFGPDAGPQPRSTQTIFADAADVDKLGSLQQKGGKRVLMVNKGNAFSKGHPTASVGIVGADGKTTLEPGTLVHHSDTPAVGKVPVEIWKTDAGQQVHVGNKVTAVQPVEDAAGKAAKQTKISATNAAPQSVSVSSGGYSVAPRRGLGSGYELRRPDGTAFHQGTNKADLQRTADALNAAQIGTQPAASEIRVEGKTVIKKTASGETRITAGTAAEAKRIADTLQAERGQANGQETSKPTTTTGQARRTESTGTDRGLHGRGNRPNEGTHGAELDRQEFGLHARHSQQNIARPQDSSPTAYERLEGTRAKSHISPDFWKKRTDALGLSGDRHISTVSEALSGKALARLYDSVNRNPQVLDTPVQSVDWLDPDVLADTRPDIDSPTGVSIYLNAYYLEHPEDFLHTISEEAHHAYQLLTDRPLDFSQEYGQRPHEIEAKAQAAKIAGYDRPNHDIQNHAPVPPFHKSRISETIERKMGGSMPADSLRSMLKNNGVRDEEMRWNGLDSLLARGGKITKQQAIDAIRAANLHLEETNLGALSPDETRRLKKLAPRYDFSGKSNAETQAIMQRIAANPQEFREYAGLASREGGGRESAGYADKTLPGGKNYRELLLKMPLAADDSSVYDPPHFGDAAGNDSRNTLAHARFDDRETQDGQRVLFLQEMQSDWHNDARRFGSADNPTTELPEGYTVERGAHGWEVVAPHDEGERHFAVMAEEPTRDAAIQAALDDINSLNVPPAPFRENWPAVVSKRMLRYAVESGFDHIAIPTTREQIATIENWDAEEAGKQDKEPVYRLYEKTIPKVLRDLGKQWGVQPQQILLHDPQAAAFSQHEFHIEPTANGRGFALVATMPEGETQIVDFYPTEEEAQAAIAYQQANEDIPAFALPITPEMRRSVLFEGQSLYNKVDQSRKVLPARTGETAPGAGVRVPNAVKTGRLEAWEAGARKRLQSRAGRLMANLDPEDLRDYAVLGAVRIGYGARTFKAWAERMKAKAAEFGHTPDDEDLEKLWPEAVDHFNKELAPKLDLPPLYLSAVPAGPFPASAATAQARKDDKPTVGLPGPKPNVQKATAAAPTSAAKPAPNRAANINLDRLETTQEVKQALQQTAAARAKEIATARRGVVTVAETVKAARDLGLTVDQLRKITPGTALPAHYAVAVRELLVKTQQDVLKAEQAYSRDQSEANLSRFMLATSEHQTVLLTATGAAAEAGRALNSYKILAEMAKEGQKSKAAVDALFKPQAETGPRAAVNPRSIEYGKANRLVTKAAADAARQRLQSKLSRLSAGVDPTLLKDLSEIGLFHLEAGLRDFGAWAKQMRAEVPQQAVDDDGLRQVWNGLRAEANRRAKPKPTPKDTARKILLERYKADANKIAAKLATVQPDDIASLNKILREEARIPVAQQILAVRKAGLLSSPRTIAKILVSHGVYLGAEEMAKVPASIMDALIARKTGQRTVTAPTPSTLAQASLQAATKGVKEAGQILQHGEKGAIRKGMQPIGRTSENLFDVTDIQTKSKLANVYIESITRAHGAAYRPAKLFAFVRSIQEQATLQARGEGWKGAALKARVKELTDNPSEAMSAQAVMDAEEAVFLNDSHATEAFRKMRGSLPATGKAVLDFLVPVQHVPVNIVGKLFNYATGVPKIALAAASKGFTDSLMDAEAQKNFSMTFGRGTVGLGIITLGYLAAKKGLATGVAQRHKDKPEGAVQAGGRWYELNSIAPVGNLFALGATLYEMEQLRARGKAMNAKSSVLKLLAEQPYLRAAEDLTGQGDPNLSKLAGSAAGSFVPTAISDLAAQMDEYQRKKAVPADFTKNRLPFGPRQSLPSTGVRETNKLVDPFNSRPVGERVQPKKEGKSGGSLYSGTRGTGGGVRPTAPKQGNGNNPLYALGRQIIENALYP